MGHSKYKLIYNTQIDEVKTLTAEKQIIKRQNRAYILKNSFSKGDKKYKATGVTLHTNHEG